MRGDVRKVLVGAEMFSIGPNTKLLGLEAVWRRRQRGADAHPGGRVLRM